MIRQIGSELLHQVLAPIDFTSEQDRLLLSESLGVMRDALYATGGIGIAANQCEALNDPRQIIIIGTDDLVGRDGAQKRYPDFVIPQETVMVNPKIIEYIDPSYYPANGEGCLSVAGPLRGQVKRYSAVKCEYQDESGNVHHQQFTGLPAHIVQHECDHLNGVVYLQKIVALLTKQQRTEVLQIIEDVLQRVAFQEALTASGPVLVFAQTEAGINYDPVALSRVLAMMDAALLENVKEVIIDWDR